MGNAAVMEINSDLGSREKAFVQILKNNLHLKSFKISVSISNCDLVISGKVHTFFQKQIAQTAVKLLAELEGLRIINEIDVT